jgi:hypothetical protein
MEGGVGWDWRKTETDMIPAVVGMAEMCCTVLDHTTRLSIGEDWCKEKGYYTAESVAVNLGRIHIAKAGYSHKVAAVGLVLSCTAMKIYSHTAAEAAVAGCSAMAAVEACGSSLADSLKRKKNQDSVRVVGVLAAWLQEVEVQLRIYSQP